MELSYGIIENIVDDPNSGFEKTYSRRLEQSSLSPLYFRRKEGDMTIEIFRRR